MANDERRPRKDEPTYEQRSRSRQRSRSGSSGSEKKRRKNNSNGLLILLIAAFFAGGFAGSLFFWGRYIGSRIIAQNSGTEVSSTTASTDETGAEGTEVPEGSASPTETAEETASSEPVTLTISCAGDCTLGRDEGADYSTSLDAYYEQYGADYFLSGVKDVFDSDDLTIVNLEGTLTESEDRADKTYAFKGPAEYTDILLDGSVEAVNLANNHSHDYGDQSFEDTKSALDAAGILHFGYDEVCVTEVNGVKVGMVGIYELADGIDCKSVLETDMQAVKDQGAELIIVTFHWGSERVYVPDETQVELGHEAVDLGANLVIGHHPHVLEGIEEYNGVNICYSLGNFCFGGNSDPDDKQTMIYQQTFTIVNGEVQAMDADNDVNIIPCTLSSASSYNDYQPTVAEGDTASEILSNIEYYSQEITETYG